MTTAYNAISSYVTSTKNATAWIKMVETNDTVTNSINNSTIPTVNCTPSAGPEGEPNTALSFNGVSSSIKTNVVVPQGQFSVRMRFKTTANTNGELATFGRVGNNTEINGYAIMANTSGKIVVYSWQNSVSGQDSITTTKSYNDGMWHDLLFTKDVNNLTTLYIDDEKVGEFTRAINYLTTTIFTLGKLDATGYEVWFNGSIADFQVYPQVLTPADFKIKSSMMFHNSEYKIYNGSEWISYGTTRPTINEFIFNGMKDLSVLDRVDGVSPLDELTPSANLVTWSANPTQQVRVIKQVQPETITQRNDVDITPLESVNGFTVVANNANFAISIDSGNTWMAYNNGSWGAITDFENGMTAEVMNGLTPEEITPFLSGAENIRFAIHLRDASSSVSILRMTSNLRGEYSVVPTSTYSFTYNREQASITYTVNRAGNFVVNFVNGE